LNDLAKYSMTRSVARSLCYSWAFCLPTKKKSCSYTFRTTLSDQWSNMSDVNSTETNDWQFAWYRTCL